MKIKMKNEPFKIPKQVMKIVGLKYKPSIVDGLPVITIKLINKNGYAFSHFSPKAMFKWEEFFNAIGIEKNQYFPLHDDEGNELVIQDFIKSRVKLNQILKKKVLCTIIPDFYRDTVYYKIVKFERIK